MKGLKYLCSLLKKKEKVIFFLGDVNVFFLLKYILYCFGKFVYYILIIFIWLNILIKEEDIVVCKSLFFNVLNIFENYIWLYIYIGYLRKYV